VPGAIAGAGGKPVLVEVTQDLVIDLDDLKAKIASSGARVLMLSHMRGHIADMDALMAICDAAGVAVIEDCAHTMGAAWNGVKSGCHGMAACYSTQTYKHMNSGEGGLLTTRDAELMARATVLSGSYMLYGRHIASPPEEVFRKVRLETPNCSGRMDNLRAAILRPQLKPRWTKTANAGTSATRPSRKSLPTRPASGCRSARRKNSSSPRPSSSTCPAFRLKSDQGVSGRCARTRRRVKMVRRGRAGGLHVTPRFLDLC
jgi:hypothetical protein